jgi:hypothetical protein
LFWIRSRCKWQCSMIKVPPNSEAGHVLLLFVYLAFNIINCLDFICLRRLTIPAVRREHADNVQPPRQRTCFQIWLPYLFPIWLCSKRLVSLPFHIGNQGTYNKVYFWWVKSYSTCTSVFGKIKGQTKLTFAYSVVRWPTGGADEISFHTRFGTFWTNRTYVKGTSRQSSYIYEAPVNIFL